MLLSPFKIVADVLILVRLGLDRIANLILVRLGLDRIAGATIIKVTITDVWKCMEN